MALNDHVEEPLQSFYVWKLVQALNVHKEKNMSSFSSRHLLKDGYIDYDTERHLLIKYFKKELADLQSRRKRDEPEVFVKPSFSSTKKAAGFSTYGLNTTMKNLSYFKSLP